MAFTDVEEASPHENYGGGRQTISIFGCGALCRRKILHHRVHPIVLGLTAMLVNFAEVTLTIPSRTPP